MTDKNPVRELLESMLKRIDELEMRVAQLEQPTAPEKTYDVMLPDKNAIFSLCQPTCSDENFIIMEYVYETGQLRRKK